MARLAMLEGAVLALLRELANDGPDGFDGFTIRASNSFEGATVIDVEYIRAGRAVAGESL